MPTQLWLSRQQLSDLQIIRDLGSSVLSSLVRHLQGLPEPILRAADLREQFAICLGEKKDVAENIVRQVLSLLGLQRQRNLKIDDIFEGLLFGIEHAEKSWSRDDILAWDAVAPAFRDLLVHPRVRVVVKSLDLSFEYANLLQSARIVTDIRPVYDDNFDSPKIEAAVVSYTLRLRYTSSDEDQSLSIALDEDDVVELLRQCQRARTKALMARELVQGKAGIPTIISGKAENGNE